MLSATTILCNQCLKLRDNLWTPGFDITYDTSTLRLRAASGECDLCDLLWKTCERYDVANEPEVQFSRVGPLFKINHYRSPVLSIFRSPGGNRAYRNQVVMLTYKADLTASVASDIPIGFRELPATGSTTSFRIINEWLHTCDMNKDHATCQSERHNANERSPRRMPTRLIDVGVPSDIMVRLHKTAEGKTGNWAALSHPWGTGHHYLTTPENLDSHMNGVPLESLPATFKDAIAVTRAIGLRYLWIDSLCIIQGADGDFDEESIHMEDVFSGAYCVIAASCATDNYSGFLRPTLPRDVVTLCRENEALFYVCQMVDDFKSHVLDGALNSRAWVLPEHALARRTIFFTEHQTYWECGQGVRCETMTTLRKCVTNRHVFCTVMNANVTHSNKAALLGDPDFPQILINASYGERVRRCEGLYEHYTRLALSNQIDRPIAIHGLQRRLLRALGASGSFGVFYDPRFPGLLPRSLLWRRGDDMHGQALSRIKFPAHRVISSVPSWSWMAYTGSIQYLVLRFGGFDWAHIESPWSDRREQAADVEGDDPDPGFIVEARQYSFESTTYDRDAAFQAGGWLYFDDPSREASTDTLCVVLGIEKGLDPSTGNMKSSSEKMNYLIVVSERYVGGQKNNVYERVGAGYLPGRCVGAASSKIVLY